MTHSLHDLNLSKAMQAMRAMSLQAPMAQMTSPQYSPLGFQMQQQPLPLWPVICQPQAQPSMSYVLDSNRHSPATTANSPSQFGSYQLMSPLVPCTGRMGQLGDDYTQPRSMSGFNRADSRRHHAARVNRSSLYNAASHHNHVDVGRIREGTDVRTTVSSTNTSVSLKARH